MGGKNILRKQSFLSYSFLIFYVLGFCKINRVNICNSITGLFYSRLRYINTHKSDIKFNEIPPGSMENTTVFDFSNNFLLMTYKICSPVCIILNSLGIYLIIFKSSREMSEYRWHLLNYQVFKHVSLTHSICEIFTLRLLQYLFLRF
uniref:G_PROTEIN_RECEP_F1_2 domain-containing protein n=1 Tax=Heterorhabditis bacteriophora TaxID=37862 RepID=A0A1I7X247_HETBA